MNTVNTMIQSCEPLPHAPHYDEYGDCPGFTGPPTLAWARREREVEEYEACLVANFYDDPITRSASFDAYEMGSLVRPIRDRCRARGCQICAYDLAE